ncbi:MAG: hypothetical protein J6T64_05820 [Bacteroidaceae bacterium]|nr:hypothetical protein [Bacteroidaceae bacterium]
MPVTYQVAGCANPRGAVSPHPAPMKKKKMKNENEKTTAPSPLFFSLFNLHFAFF